MTGKASGVMRGAWTRGVTSGLLAWMLLAALGLTGLARAHYVHVERELVAPGVFTFGVGLTGEPFAYQRDGVLRGFEIALARAVAAAHGLELRAVRYPRGELAAALAQGEVDAVNTLALDSMPEGARGVPYLVVGDHLMVLRGNPFRVRAAEDLSGRTVAATAGTSAETFAHEVSRRLERAGREPMNIHSFPAQRFAHFPVSMGHAAGYFVQTVSAVAITRDPHARTRLVDGVFRPVREVGFAVSAARERVYHALEHALAGMVATGKYERLRREYGLPPDLSPYR